MFTCWIDAAAIGVEWEVGSAKGLEEWTETDEDGLDAIRKSAAEEEDRN
jgi:hypothetical protein